MTYSINIGKTKYKTGQLWSWVKMNLFYTFKKYRKSSGILVRHHFLIAVGRDRLEACLRLEGKCTKHWEDKCRANGLST